MYGDPLSIVLYVIAILPLAEAIQGADPGVLQPCYADDVAMRVPIRRNAKMIRALI